MVWCVVTDVCVRTVSGCVWNVFRIKFVPTLRCLGVKSSVIVCFSGSPVGGRYPALVQGRTQPERKITLPGPDEEVCGVATAG